MVDFNKKILNSDKFRLAAIFFQVHLMYCLYPSGTTEYIKYWEEETERCLHGYTAADGDWISGYNYFYLNYCPILRVVLESFIDRNGKPKTRIIRDRLFADFYDYDYYYYLYIQECEDDGKHGVVLKARGRGYEQPYSAKVLTPSGFVEMGSLLIGDYVMNPGGDKTIITDIVELGTTDVYEVELRDGRKTRCGKNHLWSTVRNCHGKVKVEVLTTEELSNVKLILGIPGKLSYPYLLPNINPLHLLNHKTIPIDPYVLGVLIGDGDISGDLVKFSTNDLFIRDEMSKLLPDYNIKPDSSNTYKYTLTSKIAGVNQLNRDLKQLKLKVHSYNKFIPNCYKYTTVENRFALVLGLMDTDGSISNGASTFISTSETLIDDLVFVLRSLGIRCRKSKKIEGRTNIKFPNGCTSNTKSQWCITITTQEQIFRLPRKATRIRTNRKYNYRGVGIKKITKLDYLELQRCIVVLNDNHLYITDDFIVTHNSFKGGSMLCRNYFLIPGSKSYAVASENEYLVKDGLLTKAFEFMDFIDKHTAWAKKRVIDRTMHKKSGVLITDDLGNKTELGYLSEIIGISLKNNPDRIRGKRGKLILWEEAGMFKDILQAWQIARPSVEADGNAFGTMIAYGTGGSEGEDFRGLRSLFYECKGYNVEALPNIWDENMDNTNCGFFVPLWSNMATIDENGNRIFMDKDGNSLRMKAMEYVISERLIVLDNATDNNAVDRYIAERPNLPQEACMELSGNIFPKKELLLLLARIRTNKKLLSHKQVGDLNWVNGELLWQIKKRGDITKFPLGRDDDPTGSIVIWEHPTPNPQVGLYIGGCLTPGEMVLTERGLMAIENVTLDNKLISKDGDLVDIYNLLRYDKINEDVYTIRTSNNYRSTTFTGEHPIYVKLGTDYLFVKARNVKCGDIVKYPNIYKKCSDFDYTRLWKDYSYRIDRTIQNPLNNQDFWWFIGLWLGDGWCESDRYGISVTFNVSDIWYINKYKDVISKLFKRKYTERIRENCCEITFSFQQLNSFLTDQFGKYAHGKYIPEWAKHINHNLKQHLVLGYMASDGCVSISKHNGVSIEFVSVNLNLMEGILDILFSIGYISGITRLRKAGIHIFGERKCKTKETYHLRLSNSQSVKFIKNTYDLDNCKFSKIDTSKFRISTINRKLNCWFSEDEQYIYYRIKSISKSTYTGIVYNFECDTHTFLTRGITTHNCDPYDHDQAGTNSLGSTFIYKRFLSFEEYYDIIVAEYTGRPATAEDYYENVRKLLLYYNARLLYENERKGIFPYFTLKHCDYLLLDLPDIINDIIGNSKVQRRKGIHMTKQIRDYGEGLIKEWLNEEFAPGCKNLTRIMSEPLIEELILTNGVMNVDRVIALVMIMIHREQLHNVKTKSVEETVKRQRVFDLPIFTNEWFESSAQQTDNTPVFTFN